MRLIAAVLTFTLAAVPAAAERIDRLMQALQIEQVIEILRDEGVGQGQELNDTFLNGAGGELFADRINKIYDPAWMQEQLTQSFATSLTDSQMDRAILFFESDLGQTIVSLENSARLAFADETIKDMARENYLNGPRDTQLFRLVDEYISVNDLIDKNVQSTLSSDFSFFRGLSTDTNTRSDDLLAQLLSDKDSVTRDTRIWMYSFLLIAYQPLSESEMRENIAFSRTETGRAVNEAFFEGFDLMYDQIYYQLGKSVSHALGASDL